MSLQFFFQHGVWGHETVQVWWQGGMAACRVAEDRVPAHPSWAFIPSKQPKDPNSFQTTNLTAFLFNLHLQELEGGAFKTRNMVGQGPQSTGGT